MPRNKLRAPHKLFHKFIEDRSLKSFRENVCELLGCADISDVDLIEANVLANEVILNVNVLRAIMICGVIAHMNRALIVAANFNGQGLATVVFEPLAKE